MSTAATVAAAREMAMITLLMVSPFLLIAIVASLVVGLLQASTRMNDLTLSFVPRFLAVLLTIYLTSSWVAGRMTAYIERSVFTARGIFE